MRGGNFDNARAEILFHIAVGDYRYCAVYKRHLNRMPHKIRVSPVIGIDGHGGVAEHCFGTGGGKGYASAVVRKIFEMPQMGTVLAIIHFGVGKSGAALGTPIRYPVALINKPFVVKLFENVANRLAALLVKRKRFAAPVAARA